MRKDLKYLRSYIAPVENRDELERDRLAHIVSRPYLPKPGEFNTLSIFSWISRCSITGVFHVPIISLGVIKVEHLWNFLDGNIHPDVHDLFASIHSYMKCHDPGSVMVRWDCCAPLTLKMNMADNGKPGPLIMKAGIDTIDDPRFFDILYEYHPTVIGVFGRPWINAHMINGFPLEYRVFVNDGKIKGCSRYYPQQKLNLDNYDMEFYENLARDCITQTLRLDFPAQAYTADFIINSDMRPLFLEGGPPHMKGGGAHMCCFKPGEIEGIAIENRNE